MYAEVIYETGSKSVVAVDDLDALKEGLKEQHRRATSGEAGGPAGHAAERVKRVLLYNEHPGDIFESGVIALEEAKSVLDGVNTGGQVSVWEAIAALRRSVDPLTDKAVTGPHDSMHLASENQELDMDWLVA